MSARVEPDLLLNLKEYGAVGAEICFNCGTCTATCPLTDDEHPFPRNMIRLAQLGMRDRLLASTDPWLCYYCGDCSASCPREAEPAETMMALRRWLTAQYDHTGHGARMYTSPRALGWTVVRIMLITLAAFVLFHAVTGFERIVTDRVALNAFAPALLVWALVLIHGGYLYFRMLSGVRRMADHVLADVRQRVAIPLSIYLTELKTFVEQFITQRRWRACNSSQSHTRWLKHAVLVYGYVTMLILIVGLLWWFQTDNLYPWYHPQRWLGYLATAALIFGAVDALYGRVRPTEQLHRFSQPTDWLFPIFILTGAITGILVHIFRYAGWPWPTYATYVFHVMVMIAMLDTEVGVGKWSHLFYRPLALYLERVKQRAGELAGSQDVVVTATD